MKKIFSFINRIGLQIDSIIREERKRQLEKVKQNLVYRRELIDNFDKKISE